MKLIQRLPSSCIPLTLLLTVLLPPVVLAQTAERAETDIDKTCRSIERYFAANNVAALKRLDAAAPRWAALKQFRLAAAYIPADDSQAATKAIRNGLAIVSKALEADQDDIEMLILGSMLDGQYLLLKPWRFFWNGHRGLRRIARAESLDPDNPRIALVRGTAKFILPRFLGGSPQEAQTLFEAALAQTRLAGLRFEDTGLCQSGEWGQVDIMNWLARSHAKQGDNEASASTFSRALAYSPGNHWVRLALQGQGYEWVQPE